MNRVVLAAAVLGAALAASAPAFADGHGHGDGNRGGSFAAGRGGASMSHGAGPVGGRPAASYGRSGGFGAGHTGGSGYSGGHFSAPAGGRYGYSPGRVSSSPRYSSAPGYRSGNFAGRSSGYRPVRGIGVGGRPHSWGGGYYRGSYWPRSYYRSGFVRFWPVLPAFYSTFWFGGLPYYYWDDAYYTWSPSEYGYVATDPPPVEDGSQSDGGSAQVQSGGSSSLYVYPKNGQTEEQTATDRFECHQWAVGQTGFDPTGGTSQSQTTNSPSDYRRAMTACLDARGYSAR